MKCTSVENGWIWLFWEISTLFDIWKITCFGKLFAKCASYGFNVLVNRIGRKGNANSILHNTLSIFFLPLNEIIAYRSLEACSFNFVFCPIVYAPFFRPLCCLFG